MKTEAAQTAQAIRILLKKEYPCTKFDITSKTYSMGNNVNIHYIDSVPVDRIEKLVNPYQMGDVNCNEDMYEYTNRRKDIPQVKYVFVNREISENEEEKMKKEIVKKYNMKEWSDEECMRVFNCWSQQVLYRQFSKIEIENKGQKMKEKKS